MTGRWPANVILSPGMAEVLDEQSGILNVCKSYKRSAAAEGEWLHRKEADTDQAGYGDKGGASRFFQAFDYEPWELEWIYSVGLRPCGMEEV